MKIDQRFLIVAVVISWACVAAVLLQSPFSFSQSAQSSASAGSAAARREEAYRQNNLGVALLEQFNYKDAAEAFRRALAIDPKLSIARINLAIALFYVPDLEGAQREATVAAELTPERPQPVYILGLISKAQNRNEDAVAAFRRVLAIDPQDVGANVNLGQLYSQARRYPDAIRAFRTALAAEPYNTTAVYNLANALNRSGDPANREEGQRMLARFQELRASGVGTSIGQSYLEQGRYAEAVISTGAEPELVDQATPNVTFADASAEMLPATVAANRNEQLPVAPVKERPAQSAQGRDLTSEGRLTEQAAKRTAAAQGGGVVLFDYDTDGDLDLFEVAPTLQKLYRNDAGKFTDITEASGLNATPAGSIGIGAVAGDYDNDERPDLFVLRYTGASSGPAGALYHNDGNGKFSDRTSAAGLPPYPYLSISTALVDADHDGDLDIFIAGFADLAKTTTGDPKRLTVSLEELAGAPNMLLRNNGDGKFTDITGAAQVAGPGNRTMAVVPTDYDNRRDVDLLLVSYGGPPVLYRNLRNGTFRDVAREVGLTAAGRFTCAAAGDLNKDGFTDFFLGRVGEPSLLALSDGQGRFNVSPAYDKSQEGRSASGAPLVRYDAAQIFDYDNDGLLDTVAISDKGVRIWRNLGNRWMEVSERALPGGAAPPAQGGWWARAFASGDVDLDGDTDMILRLASGRLKAVRNTGGNRNQSVRVRLAGKVSNRSGIAAKVEARAGSLWQKLETYAASPAPAPADVVFGLGSRLRVDAVRVIWPAGIIQAETPETSATAGTATSGNTSNTAVAARTLSITELDRKPSSCPYLFTWNGTSFEFITDMMGGGEMGYFIAPGVWNVPDPDEYVRIRSDQLKARNGRYEIRVTNELEEALFMDRLQLLAVAHPEGVEVYPNEGLGNPTSSSFRLYTTRNARLPVAATDDHGADMLPRLSRIDRQYPDTFKLHRIRGYAEPHTLTLDLGRPDRSGRTLLLMTAWTDYAFSSDNVAAAQCGLSLQPPALQVKNEKGEWQTVIENIGIPVGRPQTVAVDLTGKFLTNNHQVRIMTNMRIYWDQVLVDTSTGDFSTEIRRLEAATAHLQWRGFSAETMPDGREPIIPDYKRVSFNSPWKLFPGRYTREGDVRELLAATDDMFVISRPGDEMAVSFDARRLPALPRGWTRTFLLYVDGFSKEMDINSATPDLVAPLPFHGMKSYPYKAPEKYPDTPAHRAYMERYNTRVITAPLTTLK